MKIHFSLSLCTFFSTILLLLGEISASGGAESKKILLHRETDNKNIRHAALCSVKNSMLFSCFPGSRAELLNLFIPKCCASPRICSKLDFNLGHAYNLRKTYKKIGGSRSIL